MSTIIETELNDWGWFVDIEEDIEQQNAQNAQQIKISKYVTILKTITEIHSLATFNSIEQLDTMHKLTNSNTHKAKSYCLIAVVGLYCLGFLSC
jgi:hypothetical protein